MSNMIFSFVGASVSLGIAAVLFISTKYSGAWRRKSSSFPSVGGLDYRTVKGVTEAAEKYPNQAVVFSTPRFDKIVLPPRYANELKDIPESMASFEKALYREFVGQYTGIGTYHTPMTSHLQHLNRRGEETLDLLQKEMIPTASKIIGSCEDWTAIPVSFQFMKIIAQLSSRVFVGEPLCQNEEWLDMNIQFLFASFGAAAKLSSYHPWLRPFVARFAPEVKALTHQRNIAKKLLTPIIEDRLKEHGKETLDPKADMIQWTLDSGGVKAEAVEEHVEVQLALLSVSLLGTTILLTFVLYELASHPECVEPLRAEIRSVMQRDEVGIGKGSIAKLRKLDSFIKETQRLNATTAVLLNRTIRQTHTLLDGTVLPAGADVAVNSTEVNLDELLWHHPKAFDGFRFEELRNKPGAENKHQLVKAGIDALGFGLGGQVCPGRFFAATQIKVIVSFVIINYDLRFREGEACGENTTFTVEDVFQRPKQLEFIKRA